MNDADCNKMDVKYLSDGACNFHSSTIPKHYQHMLAMEFAVKEINENPAILPNITLGFQIYDSHFNAKLTYHATMQLISALKRFVPNFKCDIQNNLLAIIGGLDSQTSLDVATILGIFKVPQVRWLSVHAFNPFLILPEIFLVVEETY